MGCAWRALSASLIPSDWRERCGRDEKEQQWPICEMHTGCINDSPPQGKAGSLGVRFHADAGADWISIAENIIDPAHRGPELMVGQPLGRKRRL